MEIEYEINKQQGCLRVWFTGAFSASALDQGCDEILRSAESAKLQSIWVDLTHMDGRPNLSHTVMLLERFKSQLKWPRIAVVEVAEQKNYSSFLQLFCTNRGLKLRVFENHDDAQSWLDGGGQQTLIA